MRMLRLVVILALGLAFGCGGDGGGGPSETAASLTAEGWGLFGQGEYELALGKFREALGLDGTYADAYNGLGWSHAKLDSLPAALADFDNCISAGMTTADPYAGKAPVYRDVEPPRFGDAVTSAGTALSKDSDYVFEHYGSFDWRDLRLIRAQSYYGMSAFLDAKSEVDALGGANLDPQSPTFVEELAAEIERLESLYGG